MPTYSRRKVDRDTTGLLCYKRRSAGSSSHVSKWDVAKIFSRHQADHSTGRCGYLRRRCRLDDDSANQLAKPQGDHAARLTITEGKYHQVKRMMSATGREFVNLTRTRFGPLDLTGLPEPGYYRLLDHSEVIPLYNLVQLDPPEI